MLKEMEAASRSEHSAKLGQHLGGIGDRAQRERGQGGVAAGVVERDRLPVEPDVVHGYSAGLDPLGGEPPSHRDRFDGQHRLHLRWVVLDIET